MHELSIAYSLVEAAESAARQNNIKKVEAVHLRLGVLSGVVKEALLFGYEIATQGTLLEGSQLEIEELPVVVYCPQCEQEVRLPQVHQFRCPVCHTLTGDIRQGKELELTSLEVRDEPAYS